METIGLILAGGASRRFGGRDKAWLKLHGRPLLCHARANLLPQVDRLVVSANRHRWACRRLGFEAIADRDEWRGRGPLAAIATVLCERRCDRLALLPVDVPMAPRNYVARLATALDGGAAAAAVFDGRRRQPLLALLRSDLAPAAADALAGEDAPSMQHWLDAVGARWIEFADAADAFANINTPGDLAQAEASWSKLRASGASSAPPAAQT